MTQSPDGGTRQGRPGLAETACSCTRLRRTARLITQAYDEALKESGLKITQYAVLANAARAEGLSISDLADRLALERTTLTRNLRPLERDGFIEVTKGSDRRARAVHVTEAGRRLYKATFPKWQAVENRFRDGMGRQGIAHLHALLDTAALNVMERSGGEP